ncbi:hypothetical protein [Salegentibacter sediminis]|uniref:hypothetical protein n=1 Tax=Salegentibacter sediminis TaxID=1930251 RepID=UPI0012FF613A|nr:hypothetical protein [Salegentibacter sediminis]
MNMPEMPVTKVLEELPDNLPRPGNDLLKSLCFNCDLRHQCTWKETRKLYCEHFE